MRKGRSLPHCISDKSCDRPGRHIIHCNGSCPFVQFVGNNISLRAICLEFSCKRVQSRTCSDYAERSRKSRRSGTTERSDGNRVRSARIGEVRTMCLEFSCKRAQSRTCSDYAECSRKSRRSSTTPQDLPQSALLAFVQISATDPVAIYPLQLFVSISLTFSAALGITRTSSVLHSLARKFVQFVGNNISSHFRCARKRQLLSCLKLSPLSSYPPHCISVD